MIKEIVLLGDNRLYQKCSDVQDEELIKMKSVVKDLHDTLMNFREINNFGRAIAAPQIGVNKRLIYMYIDKPIVIINPTMYYEGNELIEVMDDCMSFPNLFVKVNRYKKCRVDYIDLQKQPHSMHYEDDLAELIQHEYDHLEGIVATMRAIDNKSYYMRMRRN